MTYKDLDRLMALVPREAVESEECGISFAEWKAAQLNAIFGEHGTGGPGRITASTVTHGLEKENQLLTKRGDNQNGPTQ